jgi:hypothetical protein
MAAWHEALAGSDPADEAMPHRGPLALRLRRALAAEREGWLPSPGVTFAYNEHDPFISIS